MLALILGVPMCDRPSPPPAAASELAKRSLGTPDFICCWLGGFPIAASPRHPIGRAPSVPVSASSQGSRLPVPLPAPWMLQEPRRADFFTYNECTSHLTALETPPV